MAYNASQPTTIPTIPNGQEKTGYQPVRPVDVVDVPPEDLTPPSGDSPIAGPQASNGNESSDSDSDDRRPR